MRAVVDPTTRNLVSTLLTLEAGHSVIALDATHQPAADSWTETRSGVSVGLRSTVNSPNIAQQL
jgi:hypothetical protein